MHQKQPPAKVARARAAGGRRRGPGREGRAEKPEAPSARPAEKTAIRSFIGMGPLQPLNVADLPGIPQTRGPAGV